VSENIPYTFAIQINTIYLVSDISESDWSASDVVAAINNHYEQVTDDPNWYRCTRCGHKLYVDFEDEQEQIPVPATLSQVTTHEKMECPHRSDAA